MVKVHENDTKNVNRGEQKIAMKIILVSLKKVRSVKFSMSFHQLYDTSFPSQGWHSWTSKALIRYGEARGNHHGDRNSQIESILVSKNKRGNLQHECSNYLFNGPAVGTGGI